MPTRKSSLAVALAVAYAATLLAQNPPPRDNAQSTHRNGVIRGRVLNAGHDATPIRNARVSLGRTTNDKVFTDADGRFEIEAFPGRHSLIAEKTGYARTMQVPWMEYDVAEGGVVDGVEIRMVKGAAIVGRVVDDAGEPVVGAAVNAASMRIVGAELQVSGTAGGTWTDDRGEYRMGDLAPGRYVVSVVGIAEGAQVAGAPAEWSRAVGLARAFYSNAPSAATATPVVLGPGEEKMGIDFALVPYKPAKLTLSLADSTGATVSGLINLFLPGDAGVGPGGVLANRGVPISPANARMTQTLEPGDWVAVALARDGKAVAHIRLASGDETAVTLTLGSGARISGRAVFDGDSPRSASTRISVHGADLDAAAPPQALSDGAAPIKADGTFEIRGVVGTVRLGGGDPTWHIRAAKYGDRDLTRDPLTLTGNEEVRDVVVVLTDRFGEIRGDVRDENGRPAAGCAVAIYDDAARLDDSQSRRLLRADQHGRFAVAGLPSTTYRAAAAADIDGATWLATDSLERLRAMSTAVAIGDRETKTVTLVCRSAP